MTPEIYIPKGTTIAVMTDVHEHNEQFRIMVNKIKPSRTKLLVFLGDAHGKGFGIGAFENITDKLSELSSKGYAYAIKGNHELKAIRKSKNSSKMTKQLKWWRNQPLALSFVFHTGARVTAVHAGVTPRMQWDDLGKNLDVCYVRDVDENGKMIHLVWKDIDGVRTLVKSKEGGDSWHNLYDGRFGYVVSGHNAQQDGIAKFYKYSCNLDSCVYETGILSAQIFDDSGNRGELLTVKGKAKKPELHVAY